MAHYSSLLELYYTRIREFYRQPARLFWVYGFPSVLAIFLGVAFRSQPPEAVLVDVVRGDGTEAAEVVSKLSASGNQAHEEGRTAVVPNLISAEVARERLKTGKTPLVVEIGGASLVTYCYDPTRPEALMAKAFVDDALQRALGRQDVVVPRVAKVDAPGSRYIDLLIPGLIGVNTMGGGLWGVGYLLVNFRIGKLLKRFEATPMPRRDFLLALLGARLTFLLPDLGVLLLVGKFFHMPIKSPLALVILVDVVGALAFSGIGLLVASRARTIETISGLMNLIMLPMWLFSGVFFPSERFPWYLQPVVKALPLTYLVNALRRVILEGAGLFATDILVALAVLSAWAVVTFLLALRLFRWT
jgi:ABC-2 type transport system permease protein